MEKKYTIDQIMKFLQSYSTYPPNNEGHDVFVIPEVVLTESNIDKVNEINDEDQLIIV